MHSALTFLHLIGQAFILNLEICQFKKEFSISFQIDITCSTYPMLENDFFFSLKEF